MKKLLISICVAVGVYFAFSNTIDEFLYPEKRPGLSLTMFSLQTPHGRKGLLTGRAMTNDIPLKYQ